ncbi:MAG: type II toxin-antitoxin system Phd/YefM family antitoxin [Clostridia bacterium]|nr:type II toxin-antitoxin system Phd/YefM family antitoxin [Clostridia bacterium]
MQIRPIKDLRNTTEISELCNGQDEPIFITKNGYGDLVVMSMPVYNRITVMAELYQKIAQAEQEIQEGKLLDGPSTLAALREKYAN